MSLQIARHKADLLRVDLLNLNPGIVGKRCVSRDSVAGQGFEKRAEADAPPRSEIDVLSVGDQKRRFEWLKPERDDELAVGDCLPDIVRLEI
jgi:hypothetical protein